MGWQDRVRPVITLVSPLGYQFEAYWQGNPRTVAKKLGIFALPRVVGSPVQDLGVNADIYTLTLLFEGDDHDLTADQFFLACRESGSWQVTHPVKGLLSLQLSSAQEIIDPTRSGNITQINTEWIEPLESADKRSLAQQAAEINTQIAETNEVCAGQFDEIVNSGTKNTNTGAVEVVNGYLKIFDEQFGALLSDAAELRDRVAGVRRSLTDTITAAVFNAATFAAQVQELIQLPALLDTDLRTRFDAYGNLITAGLQDSRDRGLRDINYARDLGSGQELVLTAAIGGLAQVVTAGTFERRTSAVEGAVSISDLFVDITDRLDEIQNFTVSRPLNYRYISQERSFPAAALLAARGINYALTASYDLAIERRYQLKRRRAPIEIVISEYGDLGEADVNFFDFIEYNNLVGQDILILPAGREIVVYA